MVKSKKVGKGLSEYLTPDIVKIIIYTILGIFIILAIKKVIDDLFNNPLAKGLLDALGTGTVFVNDILNGCSKQFPCSTIVNSAECKSKSKENCIYVENPKDKDANKCITTGNEEGSGGPLTLSCPLFLGLITYLIALVLGGIIKFVFSNIGSKSDIAKQAATLEGKTYDEMARDISDQTKEDLAKVEDTFKNDPKNKGKEMTFKEKVYSVIEIVKRRVSNVIKDAIAKIKDAQKSAEETAKFQSNLKEIEMKQSESSEGVDGKDIDGVIDKALPDIAKPI